MFLISVIDGLTLIEKLTIMRKYTGVKKLKWSNMSSGSPINLRFEKIWSRINETAKRRCSNGSNVRVAVHFAGSLAVLAIGDRLRRKYITRV